MDFIGPVLLFVSAIGTLCLCVVAIRLARMVPAPIQSTGEGVTILKPLYGAEPQLFANLASFIRQDSRAAIQIICGVQRPTDPAIAVAEKLRAAHSGTDIMLVVDETPHGTNAKISNLINMISHARQPIIILSDSDMAVGPDYISRVTAALAAPGVKAVTCLYRGRGDAGGWSQLAAMGISQHFLPSVLLGTALGLATPCMGSTIALRQTTLDAIGGLATFADLLADDYAIGEAVRGLGGKVVVPDMVLTHACTETSLRALVQHELRWNRTILQIDPVGFLGSIVLHPLPIALLAIALMGFKLLPVVALGMALVARTALALLVDRGSGKRSGPLLWIPVRDILSFVLFLGTFPGRTVDWRGAALKVGPTGRLSTHQDTIR